MNTDFAAIQTLRDNVAVEIQVRQQKVSNILNHLAIKALEGISERLNKIEKILKTPKYDLVFIGEVGAGKTTAICHLFNLTYELEVIKKEGLKERKIIKTQEFLSTGSGRTTICEVIIKPSAEVSIEIEPYSEEDVTELIEDFCYYIWLKVYPQINDEGSQPPPAEQIRAIRNITDLNVSVIQKASTDKAVELAKRFTGNQFSDFYADVLGRANLLARTETKIAPTASKEGTQLIATKAWIQKTFESLNLAKIPNFSIPRKIWVNVDPLILDFERFPRIGSVVDTRGMDAGQTRQDLAAYIRDHDGAICLFTERFPAAPVNVASIIGAYLTRESQDIASKFVLFVMPRKEEPERVVGADGPIGVREDGLAARKADIEAAFAGINVAFVPENILFFDALQYYHSDGRRDQEYGANEIIGEQESILNQINTIISNREQVLWREAHDIKQTFEDIKHGRGLNPHDEELISDAKETIKGFRFLNLPGDSFVPAYIELWNKRYAMTLRATNARFGVYEPREINIYYDAVRVVEGLARIFMQTPKDGIIEAIAVIERECSPNSDLKPLMRSFKAQVNTYHESLIRELGEVIKEFLEDSIFFPLDNTNPFWTNVQNRFGRGPGYKNDVLSMYADQIEEVNERLRQETQDYWKKRLINRVIAFFG